MDYAEHEKTYRMLLQLIKYTVAGAALILALLAGLSGCDGCWTRQCVRSATA